jgi:hypothetical protein
MKKFILSLAVVTMFIACDNAADTEARKKDSLDSIANIRKDVIDSTAEQRKEVIDSTTQLQKDALDRTDSLNRVKDSVTRK